jgi:hypothetical protein
MKKYIAIATLAAAGSTFANAALTELFSMSELVALSKYTGTSVTNTSSAYTDGNCVYNFTGEGSILKIESEELFNYVTGGEDYLTIAAWIKPSETDVNSVFSVGGQNDGFKFALKSGGLQFTTKGISDTDVSSKSLGHDAISTSDWTLVAVTINLSGKGDSRFYMGMVDGKYATRKFGNWSSIDENAASFASGSGNSTSVRDGYKGEIANLKVFSSTRLVNNSNIADFMGAAPTLIPEPSTFGLLAGIGALALVGTRRRRK